MAERQYIGARYVPIFFNNPNTGDASWLNGVAYEPLTIVTYANSSFTSKKYVPAGIGSPNSNPEYWINTANYNAQVQEIATELRNEMDQLEQETVTKLLAKEGVFSERRYLFVGDSYAKVSPTNWVTTLIAKLAIPEGYYHDLAVSGTGFTSGPNGIEGNGFLMQLESAVQAGYYNEEITDIVVAGGLNDSKYANAASALSTLQPAITVFCNYAHRYFPKAKIWLAYVGFASDTSEVLDGRDITKRHIAQWIYSQAIANRNLGINVNIDAWKVLAQSTAYLGSDLLHPSVDGGADLGGQIAHWLSGGTFYVHRFEYNYAPFRIMMDNNGAHLETLTEHITSEIPANPNGYVFENVLPFYVNKKFTTYGYIQSGGSGTYTLNSIMYEIENRSVRIIPNILGSTGWEGLPAGNHYLTACKFTIPWEYIG